MNKTIYYNELFTIYKNMLTAKQIDIFSLYYEENLSMQEIADLKKVSKSFIGKLVKDVEYKLDDLEKELHLLAIRTTLDKLLEEKDIDIIKKEIKDILK